jgi:DNA-directed RNA polymerase specialized sigma24 family protein
MDEWSAEFEPRTLAAFRGVILDERSAADVARELGLTINAVHLAILRVRRRLQQELAGLIEGI